MSRRLRIEYPAAIYHVRNRGDQREAISSQLPGQPKGHSGKVMMARRLRQETTLSLKWIAQRLPMGTWTYVSNLLNETPESPAAQEGLPLCP